MLGIYTTQTLTPAQRQMDAVIAEAVVTRKYCAAAQTTDISAGADPGRRYPIQVSGTVEHSTAVLCHTGAASHLWPPSA